jgi:hypothetical protein
MTLTRTCLFVSVAVGLLLSITCVERAVAQKQTPAAPANETPNQVTVPLIVEGNRPYIELNFYRSDGSKRSARFLVDSGGGGFLLSEPLARDLGLTWGEVSQEEGEKFATTQSVPRVSVGDALTLTRFSILNTRDHSTK